MQEFNITISKPNGELEEIIANDNMTLVYKIFYQRKKCVFLNWRV